MYLSISLQREDLLNREHGRSGLIKSSGCRTAILKHVPLTDLKLTERTIVET